MEDDANDSLVNGDGSVTDFSANYGDQYVENQNPYDSADNGTITQTGASGGATSSTYTPPSWLSSLTGLLNAGAPLASTVATTTAAFTNKPSTTSAAAATKANTTGGLLGSLTGSTGIILAIVAGIAVLAFLLFKRR